MGSERILFWAMAFAGSVVGGWWLSARPGAICRDIATPIAVLVIIMAVLLALLVLTGQDVNDCTARLFSDARWF